MNTPISSKTGQPMAAVRFSVYDMQGKLLCMAISPYFLHTSPKKTSPAAARRRDAFIGDSLNRRAAAGEGLAGGGPRGTGLSERLHRVGRTG